MRVYLAGRTSNVRPLRNARVQFQHAGHAVTSRWLDTPDAVLLRPPHEPCPDPLQYARHDLEDIRNADVIVVFVVGWQHARGGMHFEAGYALALGKPGAVVGWTPSIFYQLPGFTHVPTLERAVVWATNLERQRNQAVHA